MGRAVIWDCEFWSDEGCLARGWQGIQDPPPMLVQIGAMALTIVDGRQVAMDHFEALVRPLDQFGERMPLTRYFVDLTGIDDRAIDLRGMHLARAMTAFDSFCGGARLWSYGHGDIHHVSLSCYMNRIICPLDPSHCHDVRLLLRRAGVSDETISRSSSGTLAAALGYGETAGAHNALNDVRSVHAALHGLRRDGMFDLNWLMERPHDHQP